MAIVSLWCLDSFVTILKTAQVCIQKNDKQALYWCYGLKVLSFSILSTLMFDDCGFKRSCVLLHGGCELMVIRLFREHFENDTIVYTQK